MPAHEWFLSDHLVAGVYPVFESDVRDLFGDGELHLPNRFVNASLALHWQGSHFGASGSGHTTHFLLGPWDATPLNPSQRLRASSLTTPSHLRFEMVVRDRGIGLLEMRGIFGLCGLIDVGE